MTPLFAGSLTFLASALFMVLAFSFTPLLITPLYRLEKTVTTLMPDLKDSYLRLIIPCLLGWLISLYGLLLLHSLLQPPLGPHLFVGITYTGAAIGALARWCVR